MFKKCTKCLKEKNDSLFYKRNKGKYLTSWCGKCLKEKARDLRRNFIDKRNPSELRVCRKCQRKISVIFFRPYHAQCKECIAGLKRIKDGVIRRPNKITNGMKICTMCGINKFISEYYRLKNGIKPRCKKCSSILASKNRRYKMIDKIFNSWIKKIEIRFEKFVNRKRRRLPVEEIKKRAYTACKRWKEKHPSYYKKWVENNRDKARLWWHKRNSTINASDDGSVTAESLKAMMYRQNNQCNFCKKDITNKYHIDHIMPISKGGLHSLSNIQLLCPYCNISKGAKILSNPLIHEC